MKFIKTKVNPHYLSHLGSMNQSKRIPGPGVSLLTVPASPDLQASSFCSRVGSQQIYCFGNLEVLPCVKAFPESEHFLHVCMCSSFLCVYFCVCLCVSVCLCMWYVHMWMFVFACVVYLCVCLCVCIWHTDFWELH